MKTPRLKQLVRNDDSGIAMMTVLVMLIMVSMLSVLVLGAVMVQIRPTLVNAKSTRTIAAAQAGIDAAAAQIRNAIQLDDSGVDMGDIHKLPCSVAGKVDERSDATEFRVEIRYYTTDPSKQTKEWQDDETNQLPCNSSDPSRLPGISNQVPGYALLISEGKDETATASQGKVDRSVRATYRFSHTTVNTAGGQIFNQNKSHCIVADGIAPGEVIRYQDAAGPLCTELTEYNLWYWDTDYMIHLANSKAAGAGDLCMSARPTSTSSYAVMTLQLCATDDRDDLGQRFSWRDGGTWRGQNAANTEYANTTIQAQISSGSLTGQPLTVGPTSTAGDAWKAFEPQPNVGAGAASKQTDQIVSQLEFGRCLDVFRDKLYMPYHILYPCKQDPSGNSGFRWNHKWRYSEPDTGTTSVPTKIIVIPTLEGTAFSWYGSHLNTQFCLLTPASAGMPAGVRRNSNGTFSSSTFPIFNTQNVDMRNYAYVRFTNSAAIISNTDHNPPGFGPDCNNVRAQWTRYGDTGDPITSWTFQDFQGRCLSAKGPKHHGNQGSNVSYGGDLWTTIVVEECDGTLAQKWNAANEPPARSLRDFTEIF